MNGPETSPETTLDALSFEQALSELEAIVEQLEGGAVSLDKAIDAIPEAWC